MSVDTKEMRTLAGTGYQVPFSIRDALRSAAAEIDELRQDQRRHLAQIEATAETTAVRYSQQIRDLRAAHETTKRELEELRVSYDRGVASFAKMHTEALAERARRESAEAALRFEAGMDRIGDDIDAEMHFALYPRETEGT